MKNGSVYLSMDRDNMSLILEKITICHRPRDLWKLHPCASPQSFHWVYLPLPALYFYFTMGMVVIALITLKWEDKNMIKLQSQLQKLAFFKMMPVNDDLIHSCKLYLYNEHDFSCRSNDWFSKLISFIFDFKFSYEYKKGCKIVANKLPSRRR